MTITCVIHCIYISSNISLTLDSRKIAGIENSLYLFSKMFQQEFSEKGSSEPGHSIHLILSQLSSVSKTNTFWSVFIVNTNGNGLKSISTSIQHNLQRVRDLGVVCLSCRNSRMWMGRSTTPTRPSSRRWFPRAALMSTSCRSLRSPCPSLSNPPEQVGALGLPCRIPLVLVQQHLILQSNTLIFADVLLRLKSSPTRQVVSLNLRHTDSVGFSQLCGQ